MNIISITPPIIAIYNRKLPPNKSPRISVTGLKTSLTVWVKVYVNDYILLVIYDWTYYNKFYGFRLDNNY